ncbi:siderophore-interacting protein [Marinomonas sp. IMCC 4694]|uniref:siderophore-interacting protein n=1 Tax=Marinomonas sp. IMCC 4694 TaxID=2605432 RepID=UPI0011E7B529|nr:siderophore-interacting protein [Marinomonas sp. IMCC 4694]TYL47798.1 siderophore-interacting protein [Marinomonas sp. IMCC 4694]
MTRPQPRELRIVNKNHITPHMLRITLGGDQIHTLPKDQEGGYVKLIFPQVSDKPILRTYTIRHQRDCEIDIDFVLHEDGGPASTWARHAQIGEAILVGGPGPVKPISGAADWQFFVGDMTALPAISVNLANLPDTAKGAAILEVLSQEDVLPLVHPSGIELHWVINPHPGESTKILLERVKALPWPKGSVSAWVACEFSAMKALRSFFKIEKQLLREHLYISSYWKKGNSEDQHKVVKRTDNEAES